VTGVDRRSREPVAGRAAIEIRTTYTPVEPSCRVGIARFAIHLRVPTRYADTVSLSPSARMTLSTVANSGFPSPESAL
jgi:hypothetical protein